jgi:hypothetical protein
MRLLQVSNLLAYAVMVAVNYLAVFLPLNGQTTGEVARQYSSLFIPAGFVFVIWRLIYLLLAGFAVYQAGGLLRAKPAHPRLLARIGIFFILSSLANIGWIFMWHHHRIGLALVMSTLILLSLFIIYVRLGIGIIKVDRREWFFTRLPFSIYLGWITISTVGNLSVFLVARNWDGWGLSQAFWTVLAIFCLAAAALLFLWKYRDRAFVLTFVWVFTGVFIQRLFAGDPSHYIVGLAAAAAAVFLLAAAFIFKSPEKRVAF